MIRRIRSSLCWLAVLAAILLLTLPVQADDIEPEPYVEEEPEPTPVPEVEVEEEVRTEIAPAVSSEPSLGSKIFDCVVLRPLGFVSTIIGGAFFVPAAVLASPSGSEGIQAAWEHFVATQADYTFTRPLGEF